MIRSLSILGCLIIGLASGCVTTAEKPPVVIGERVFAPAPNTDVHLGPLLPPAKQWYVVDDVGLQQWLGIEAPATTK